MQTAKSIRKGIRLATTTEQWQIRKTYRSIFSDEIDHFVEAMSLAYERWRELDHKCEKDQRRAYASSLVYSAISLQISSMNLFLSGWLVAAGNIQRQVLEAMSLAFLVTSPQLDVFDKFKEGVFRSNKAPKMLLDNIKLFMLNDEAVKILIKNVNFYHNFSHAGMFTLASTMSAEGKSVFIGAAFDLGRINQYHQEAERRTNLAKVFENFVMGVMRSQAINNKVADCASTTTD